MIYLSLNDKRIEEQREENQAIAGNFFKFFREWLNTGKNAEDPIGFTYEIIITKFLVDDNYLVRCWDRKHFNKSRYTKEKINKKLNEESKLVKTNRWQLKRGLGLALEHLLVYHFADKLIPAYNNIQAGTYAFDFYVLAGADKTANYYDKVDLKISFGATKRDKAMNQRNNSIYNIEVVIDWLQLLDLLDIIKAGDSQKLKEFCRGIYEEVKEELKYRNRRELPMRRLNIKNSDNSQLSEFPC